MAFEKGDHMNSVERENEGETVDMYRSENILDHRGQALNPLFV